MWRIRKLSLLLLLGFLCQSGIGFSAEETAGDYFYGMGSKIGRGLWNVLSSPAEIPCTMAADVQEQGGSGYATGFGKGILFFLRRVLVGVTEVGTFVIPMGATIPPVCSK